VKEGGGTHSFSWWDLVIKELEFQFSVGKSLKRTVWVSERAAERKGTMSKESGVFLKNESKINPAVPFEG